MNLRNIEPSEYWPIIDQLQRRLKCHISIIRLGNSLLVTGIWKQKCIAYLTKLYPLRFTFVCVFVGNRVSLFQMYNQTFTNDHLLVPLIIRPGRIPPKMSVSSWCKIEIEQGLTSHQTHYRSYRGRFYRSYDQTNSVKALKETSLSCR